MAINESLPLKNLTSCSSWRFLRTLKEHENLNKNFNAHDFAREERITLRQVERIVESLCKAGYIYKIKNGYFIENYKLTEYGNREIQTGRNRRF